MSVTIYSGIRFKISSLDLLFTKLKLLQPQMMKIAQRQEAELVARVATRRIDLATIAGDNDPQPLISAGTEIQDRQRKVKLTGQRDPSVDFSFSVMVIPTDHFIIGTFYTENEELTELFSSQTWIEDYHYQNQTDKPAEISTFEWENREKTWNKFVDFHKPLMYSGFKYQLTDTSNFFGTLEDILPHVPSIEDRAKGLSADLSLMAHFKEIFGDNKIEAPEAMRVANEFLQNEDSKAKIEAKYNELLMTLKPSITSFDLLPPRK